MTATRTQKTAIDQRLILELSIDAQGEVTRKPSQLGRKDTLEGKLLAEIYPGIQVARVSVPHELTPYEQSVVENRMAKLIYGGVEYRLVGASNSAKLSLIHICLGTNLIKYIVTAIVVKTVP